MLRLGKAVGKLQKCMHNATPNTEMIGLVHVMIEETISPHKPFQWRNPSYSLSKNNHVSTHEARTRHCSSLVWCFALKSEADTERTSFLLFHFQRVRLLQANNYSESAEFVTGSCRKLTLIQILQCVSFSPMKTVSFMKIFSANTIQICVLLTDRKAREVEMHKTVLLSMYELR